MLECQGETNTAKYYIKFEEILRTGSTELPCTIFFNAIHKRR